MAILVEFGLSDSGLIGVFVKLHISAGVRKTSSFFNLPLNWWTYCNTYLLISAGVAETSVFVNLLWNGWKYYLLLQYMFRLMRRCFLLLTDERKPCLSKIYQNFWADWRFCKIAHLGGGPQNKQFF